jgi:hypothetical protein
MKDIQLYVEYLTRDGHRVLVTRKHVTCEGRLVEWEGQVRYGPILPAGRAMNWKREGAFVGSLASEKHALDIVKRAYPA